MNPKKNMLLKIGIPVLIVCLIVAIWAVKNKKSTDENVTSTTSSTTAISETTEETSAFEADTTITAETKELETTTETTTETTATNSTEKQIDINNPDFDLNYTNDTDLEKLKSYGLPIIIDFGAEWCGPCQELAPIIDELNEELRGKAIIKFVDTDSKLGIIGNYDFQYIPMQIFINSEGNPYIHSNDEEWESKYDPDTNELLYTMHTGVLQKDVFLNILKEMGME